MMVSLLLLGIVSAVVFGLFFQGMRAWRVSDTQRDLVEASRTLVTHLSLDVERSSYAGLSLQPEAVSLVSALDGEGHFALGPAGEPLWQRFEVYYRTGEELRLNEFEAGVMSGPLTLEASQGATLSTFMTGGRLLAAHVKACAWSVPAGTRRLDYSWTLEWKRGGGLSPLSFTVSGTTRFRNP